MDIPLLLSKYYSGRQWSMNGEDYSGLEFSDGLPAVTLKELQDKYVIYQAEMAATEYQRKRKAEYPNVEDLVVALWESIVESDNTARDDLQTKRIAIKAKYPKP